MSSQHPTSYKAAQISEKGGKFEVVDVAWKDPAEGEIVVKVLASGVCHSDDIVVGQHMPTGLPRVPGHEIVGNVYAVSGSEKRFKVGDRVGSGWHGGHCHVCLSCRKGDFVTCSSQAINGISKDGGHAQFVTLRSEAVCMVSAELDPVEAAPLLCAGLTVANSLRNAGLHPGDVVCVQGVGGLGSMAIQYARKSGYRTVALSSGPSKEKLSRELGAHDYVDGSKVDQAEYLQKLGGAKLILCTAPNGKVIETLMSGLAVDGQLILLAVADTITIPVVPMIMKRLSVKGWPSGTAQDSEECIEFAHAAGIKCLVERYSLSQANEAFDSMMTGKARFRSVLDMSLPL